MSDVSDEQEIAAIYDSDSVLVSLKKNLEQATTEVTKLRAAIHELDAEKRRLRRALDQNLGLLNRSKRRIKVRERILVDRYMQDKVIRLRRQLGITPRST